MLNVSRLRMLAELKRCGTLTEVARVLSYTPSAVSQQLSLLEREAGVVLLEKVGRGVHLTHAAETLVEHADAVLRRLEQAEAELAAAQSEVRGTLRVASFQTVVMTVLPAALTVLDQRHPQLQVAITQREVDSAYQGLMAGDFDVMVGEELPGFPVEPRPGWDRVDLLQDPQILAVPLTGRFSARVDQLADLAQAPWALDAADTHMGVWSRSMCRTAGFEPLTVLESPDPALQLHMVRAGHAVAFVHGLVGAQYTSGTQLIELPGRPHRKIFTAARSSRAQHPAILAFREVLTEVAQGLGTVTGNHTTMLMPPTVHALSQ